MDVRRWSAIALVLVSAPFSAAFAQDDDPETTLPETVVEGEGDEGDAVTPDDFSNLDAAAGEYNFPSIGNQFIGGLDGGTRGPQMSLFDNPQAIDIITQQDIVERGPSDMGAILEQTVGVMVQRTGRGQSSPYVRGVTGQQVLVMVDGVRLTQATHRSGPNQYFNTIDPNMVERIEVIRGSGAVLYGADAIGGVINVVTKRSKLLCYDYKSGSTVQRFRAPTWATPAA